MQTIGIVAGRKDYYISTTTYRSNLCWLGSGHKGLNSKICHITFREKRSNFFGTCKSQPKILLFSENIFSLKILWPKCNAV
jgi:hypothetical protein